MLHHMSAPPAGQRIVNPRKKGAYAEAPCGKDDHGIDEGRPGKGLGRHELSKVQAMEQSIHELHKLVRPSCIDQIAERAKEGHGRGQREASVQRFHDICRS